MKTFKAIWKKWKALATKIGAFQSRVILTLFYFVLFMPFGLLYSLLKDELGIKTTRSNWKEKKEQPETIEEMRKQY